MTPLDLAQPETDMPETEAPATEAPAPEAPAPEAPKLGRKRDHTRDPEILAAALDVLAETGYERMTVDMVAARAKAGKATVYRRWGSKEELVIEAVACMKKADLDEANIPDTGSLRGDLVAMIRPHSIEDGERKLRIMAGLTSMVARDPDFAKAAAAAIVEPRARINRMFLQRAIDRGEITADVDIAVIASISPSMAFYRTLMLNKPVDREFLISVVDGVILPAVGLSRP